MLELDLNDLLVSASTSFVSINTESVVDENYLKHPYDVAVSPIALSPCYITDSYPKEDSEDGPVDCLTNGGADDDDFSYDDDEENEEALEGDEEHLAPVDDFVIPPAVDFVPSFEETEPFKTDESAATPPPPPLGLGYLSKPRHLFLFYPRRRPRDFLPYLQHHHHHSSHYHHPQQSNSLLASLSIPPPVDRRKDIPEVELAPRKRLFLTSPTLRYEVRESLIASRPIGVHRVGYGFIGTLDVKTKRQRVEEVGYGIRDVWVDLTGAVEEVASTTLTRSMLG
uniref:Uncharacterized protein n=1 Tax=Tanacetum cinerariifolium TaxID=118510 RepID=A0A6L2KKG7_TANCI|nr:hypothetical protein [Tanacetum cinerariifolium]